jgi:hypothetical protein
MLCEQYFGVITMLIYDQCSQGWHMGCLTPPWEKILIENGSTLDSYSYGYRVGQF